VSACSNDLRREIGRIEPGGGTFHDVTKVPDFRAFTPAPPDPRLRESGSTQTHEERGHGALASLIKAAKSDPKFPLDGSPDDVRARLNACGAEGDMFEAVDDAELDWVAL
jgi:hypothetical protein